MSENVRFCAACGAKMTQVENRAVVFCPYCGCKNVFESQMAETQMETGQATIKAHTDGESIMNTAEYYLSQKDRENMLKWFLRMMEDDIEVDVRFCILSIKISLYLDFTDADEYIIMNLNILKEFEEEQEGTEVTDAVRDLMHYTSEAGFTVLHKATFYEQMDAVIYCVEHGADVNREASMERYTPIGMMFKPIDPKEETKFDGSPLVRDKKMVKQIRSYLMEHGAKDKFRFEY